MKKLMLITLVTMMGMLGLAHAEPVVGEIGILPVCLMKGPVYLQVNDDTVRGYVGNDFVELARYQGFIYGEIKEKQIALNVYRNDSVKGTIGNAHIDWRMSKQGDAVYGYQNCLYSFD